MIDSRVRTIATFLATALAVYAWNARVAASAQGETSAQSSAVAGFIEFEGGGRPTERLEIYVQTATGGSRFRLFSDPGGTFAIRGEMWNAVLSGFFFQAEVTIRKKNGEPVTLDEVVTPITDARGNVTHALVTASDITPVKMMKDKLSYLTFYDDLTGLPNRSLFAERLNRDCARVLPRPRAPWPSWPSTSTGSSTSTRSTASMRGKRC